MFPFSSIVHVVISTFRLQNAFVAVTFALLERFLRSFEYPWRWTHVDVESHLVFFVSAGQRSAHLPDVPVGQLVRLQGDGDRRAVAVGAHLPGEAPGRVRRRLLRGSGAPRSARPARHAAQRGRAHLQGKHGRANFGPDGRVGLAIGSRKRLEKLAAYFAVHLKVSFMVNSWVYFIVDLPVRYIVDLVVESLVHFIVYFLVDVIVHFKVIFMVS